MLSLFFLNNATVTLIDSSGVFPLGGSIIADPQAPNDTIVTITASNVIFDINEFILTQNSTNFMPGLNGVFIAPNLTNVTVRTGTITNLTGIGVYVSDGCSQIYLENLSIMNCNQAGILLDGNPIGSGINDVSIINCLVSSCTGINMNNAYGLRMIATYNTTIANCTFSNNKTYSADAGYGIYIESCSSCEFNNCKSYDNGGNIVGVGISAMNSNGCSFIACNANGNNANSMIITATSCGFLINSCSASLFSSCKALDNSNAIGSGIGFNSHNNFNNIFEYCMTANNMGGILAAGFYFADTNSNFGITNNICAANIANFTNGIAYGVLLDGAQGFLISNNTFTSNLGSQGYGLVDTTLNTNNLMTNNLSYNNTTTGYSVSFTQGEFPVNFASNNNFSTLTNTSQYFNVAIVAN